MSAIENALKWEKSKIEHMGFKYIFRINKNKIKRSFLFRYRKPFNCDFLNLGSGITEHENFCSADYFGSITLFWRRKQPFWLLDARKKWACPDEFWEGIFSQHMLEHLTYEGAIKALEESFRTLKKGKYIRIVLPDLEKYVSYYTGENSSDDFKKFQYGALAISNLTQNATHISTWDYPLLHDILEEIGFKKIKKVNFMEGSETDLLIDSPSRRWASFYVEAKKEI